MSADPFGLIRCVTRISSKILNCSQKLILKTIIESVGLNKECWHSVGTLAEYCSILPQAFRKNLKVLVQLGYVQINQNGGGSKYNTNRYSINEELIRGAIGIPLNSNKGGELHPTKDIYQGENHLGKDEKGGENHSLPGCLSSPYQGENHPLSKKGNKKEITRARARASPPLSRGCASRQIKAPETTNPLTQTKEQDMSTIELKGVHHPKFKLLQPPVSLAQFQAKEWTAANQAERRRYLLSMPEADAARLPFQEMFDRLAYIGEAESEMIVKAAQSQPIKAPAGNNSTYQQKSREDWRNR